MLYCLSGLGHLSTLEDTSSKGKFQLYLLNGHELEVEILCVGTSGKQAHFDDAAESFFICPLNALSPGLPSR